MKTMKEMNDKDFMTVYDACREKGMWTLERCIPEPMTVTGGAPNQPKQTWVVPDGMCGFAWIQIWPGNCRFANWLRKMRLASNCYDGGVSIWVSEGGQSISKKEAYAEAFDAELKKQIPEITSCARSRLD